ncbi:MAG: hypothetical protein R8J85_04550 [Mariprofundales bacterium]
MRLTKQQTIIILDAVVRITDNDAAVKGGDVDLLLETVKPLPLLDRARIKMVLEQQLGLPVDIIAHCQNDTPTPFQTIAKAQSIRLEHAV